MDQNLQDLKISGAGSAGGGKYNDVKISGAGNINGDIECKNFKTSGSSDTKGNVKAILIDVSGASEIDGNVEAEEIKVSGSSKIRGDVFTRKIKISGSSEIGGNLHGEEVDISGVAEIDGDCEVENFNARGGFKVGGLLSADEIRIEVGGKCRAKEIGGERIDVKEAESGIFYLNKIFGSLLGFQQYLTTEVIEGDNIYLEKTNAKIVRGNNITIGKGCLIDTVEYKGELKIQGDGRVENQIKL